MDLAFVYPSHCMPRPLDPERLYTSDRGLTGSELTCVEYAKGLAERGHSVELFTNVTQPGMVGGLRLRPDSEWDGKADCAVSFMSADPLKLASDAFRVFNMQVSDFAQSKPGWERNVDALCCLSRSHVEWMRPQTTLDRDKFHVMHNGVDVERFAPLPKIPGRVVWASSHDRGLHWILELWPKVRRHVPHAELHVFYDTSGMEAFARTEGDSPLIRELRQRSNYCLGAIDRLSGSGVVLRGSVSRETMREELGCAEVLAYPCDPVRYTETFGVTVLEAMASGCVPVIASADAFAELWCPVAPHVPAPYVEHRAEYLDLLVSVLRDRDEWDRYRSACMGHAHRFAWPTLVSKLERFLKTRGQEGLA